ncbi:MAG: CDP-alcohol phosphatidyltransferase family protein [Acidobacteria bacterium]|nr:CDP-alcohol phosphatidyltransferase family protein [Acidobacteriota bacterium]
MTRGPIFTVPNQLTFLRLAFLPFFVMVVHYDKYEWALGILVAAAISDFFDGLLARSLNQRSALGAYLDPIADKLLLSSSFFVLALKGKLVWWLTILVLGRDVLILVTAAAIIVVVGYQPLPPSLYGKLTTGSQIILVFVAVALEIFEYPWLYWLMSRGSILVAALTIFSGIHYSVIVARRLSAPAH